MVEDLLDWDAFEKMDKRTGGTAVPPESVSVTGKTIWIGRSFRRHFDRHGYVEVYYQPTAILLTPSDDEQAFKFSNGSISSKALITELRLAKGYYPAEWIEDRGGLLIDISPRLRPRPQPQPEEEAGGLAGVLG